MPVPIDVHRHGGVVAARQAAIRELVEVHHLDPTDAQLDVDGRILDAAADVIEAGAAALSTVVELGVSVIGALHDALTVEVPAQRTPAA